MRYLRRLTLGKKIFLLLSVGLVVGIGIFSFLGFRAVNQATEVMLEDRLTTAQLVAGYLDETLHRALLELESRAASIEYPEDNETLINEMEGLQKAYSRLSIPICNVYIVDTGGRVVWNSLENDSGTLEDNIAFYPGINEVSTNGSSYVSALVSDPLIEIPVILLFAAIPGQGGAATADALVVSIDVSQSSIGGFVHPIQLGETGYVEIVDQNGIVVTRTTPGPQLEPFEKSDHSARFATLIASGQPTRGLCHTCHEPIQKVERRDVLAFVPLSVANWGVIIRQSEDEALAAAFDLRQSLLIFGAALTVGATLTVVLTTRDVISRLKSLTAASRRIAGGDLDGSISDANQDEVGMLAVAFEDMRARLKKFYGELEQRTKELSHLLSVSEMVGHLPELSDLDSALGGVLERTLEIVNGDVGAILVLDEEKHQLYCQSNRGFYRKREPHFSYRLDDGISSQTVLTGELITTEDILRERRFDNTESLMNEEIRGIASVPLRSKEKVMGVMNIGSLDSRSFTPEDIRLLEGIARLVSAAIENAALHREVREKEEVRGELLQDMFTIQEEERKRIARELHDETSQVVASLNASLETATILLTEDSAKARKLLEKSQSMSLQILDEVHKMIYELRPSLLDDLGLVAATRWLAEENLESIGIAVKFKISGKQRRLPPKIEATLFRIIQEATNNIARHSQAKNTGIDLSFKRGIIKVRIKDDGRGFDVEEAVSSKDRPRGLGLIGMRERVTITGGRIDIKSDPQKGGTEILIEIPLGKETEDEKN